MPRPLRTARRRRTAGAIGAALVLVGVVALAGGFADVPRTELPRYRVGQTFDNGLYRVTVRSISVVQRDPLTGYDLERPAIAAEADLLYRGERSTRGALRWLRPLDVDLVDSEDDVRTERDGVAGPPVQPGVPVRVLYTWALAGSTVSADDVRLGVYERYEAEDVPLEGVLTRPVLVGVFQDAS